MNKKRHPRTSNTMKETLHWPGILGKTSQIVFSKSLIFFQYGHFLSSYGCCFFFFCFVLFCFVLFCFCFLFFCFLSNNSSKTHSRRSSTMKEILDWPDILGKFSYRQSSGQVSIFSYDCCLSKYSSKIHFQSAIIGILSIFVHCITIPLSN